MAKQSRYFRLIHTSNYSSDYDYFFFLFFFFGFLLFHVSERKKKKKDCKVFGQEKMNEEQQRGKVTM